jgi:asparagine synthase (glutamine-hydrolysing)
MCGITGIINKNNNPVDKLLTKKINNLISHRGPDDEGFYFGDNFAFGHRRLSILDLSQDGHQPMHYNDRYTITYNGEVYNYIELKDELKKLGYSFNSNTDTEVILAAYDKWGESCVNKFNGMWSFALFDRKENNIFCSRDRFGIKPFYYTEVDNKFIFGSEIKQLLEFHDRNLVNKDILIDFIVTRFEDYNNDTFFQGIKKLEQSHNLIYDLNNHSFSIKRYYDITINDEVKKLSLDDSISEYREKFNQAINYRLRSDVKVGTCLSGGLDSSSIASIAAQEYNKKSSERFTAIHAKSSEKTTDESGYAKLVSDYSNINLVITEPSSSDIKNSINEVVYTQEEPFAYMDVFLQYFVMKKAKEEGCTVMLDGQGGDETLLGYSRYYPSIYYSIFKNDGIFPAIKSVLNSKKNNAKMRLNWILKFTIGSFFSSMRKRYLKYNTSFLRPYKNTFSILDKISNSFFNVNDLQVFDIYHTNLPLLLRYEDKNSMRHSVETRLPFLDYNALEVALSINTNYKIKDGWSKYILRKSIGRNIPEEVIWRKNKLGFNPPESTWFEFISADIKDKISESKILNKLCKMDSLLNRIDSMHYHLQWRLYNIAIWEKIYDVEID